MSEKKIKLDFQKRINNLYQEPIFRDFYNNHSKNPEWFMRHLIKLKKQKRNKISSIAGPKWMVRNYINGIRFRVDDFICGILDAHNKNNFISVAVLSRHLLETVAHSHLFLNTNIKSAIEDDNKEKYTKYLKSLMTIKDISNEGEESIIFNEKMKTAFDGKHSHISDSMRNYKKFLKLNFSDLHAKDFDTAYNHLSQLSHPNPLGIMYFYRNNNSRDVQEFAKVDLKEITYLYLYLLLFKIPFII